MTSALPASEVSIVIPNLNGESLLEPCLLPLRRAQVPVEVLLVDNGSTDRSLEIARRALPPIQVIANERNVGFAPACNQGARAAHGRYLLFLNSDVVLTEGCLAELVAWAEADPDGAAWQPKLLRGDRETWDSAGSYFTSTGFLWHDNFGEKSADEFTTARNVFALKGACLLVRSDAFRAVGGFDEDFFAYFEETDLCWRLQLAGWSIRVVPVGCAFHEVGATTTRFFSPAQIDYLAFRNRITSLVKNAGTGTLVRVLPAHLAVCFGVALLFPLKRRWSSAWAILRALLSVSGSWRTLAAKRRETQKLRVRADREYLPQVSVPMTVARGRRLLAAYLPRW